jgi:carbon monoxide dehydrogenase subunit G
MTITVKYKTVKRRWEPKMVFNTDIDDVRNIVFDYSGELGSDAISTATATASDITAGSPSIAANVVTISMSGGTAGSMAKLELKVTTTGGDTISNTVRFRAKDNYENL